MHFHLCHLLDFNARPITCCRPVLLLSFTFFSLLTEIQSMSEFSFSLSPYRIYLFANKKQTLPKSNKQKQTFVQKRQGHQNTKTCVFMKKKSFFVSYNYQAYTSSNILSFFSISHAYLLFLIDIDSCLV